MFRDRPLALRVFILLCVGLSFSALGLMVALVRVTPSSYDNLMLALKVFNVAVGIVVGFLCGWGFGRKERR